MGESKRKEAMLRDRLMKTYIVFFSLLCPPHVTPPPRLHLSLRSTVPLTLVGLMYSEPPMSYRTVSYRLCHTASQAT